MSVLFLSATCCGASTKDLIDQCRDAGVLDHDKLPAHTTADQITNATACMDYLRGFVAGYAQALRATGTRGPICIPASTTTFQLAAVYVTWGDRNPGKWNLGSGATVLMAFQEAFPCNPN
jgi:hypothetical protein